jgi:DNA processing protein
VRISPDDAGYPRRLRESICDKPILTVTRPLERTGPVVAIVGSREPLEPSVTFAYELAGALARAGVTVVSGGAKGVDRAAHEGALDGGGRTWVVMPCGEDFVYPADNADLFARVKETEGSALVHPFPSATNVDTKTPRARNKVLVTLADAVVVVQARTASGSRNAAKWARGFGVPLWIVPAAPWMEPFSGSLLERERGARPLCRAEQLLATLGVRPRRPRSPVQAKTTPPPRARPQGRSLPLPRTIDRPGKPAARTSADPPGTTEETVVFSRLSSSPTHVDQIVSRTGLGVGAVITALLTLSVKNVVVEGPDGFFRRTSAR